MNVLVDHLNLALKSQRFDTYSYDIFTGGANSIPLQREIIVKIYPITLVFEPLQNQTFTQISVVLVLV